MNMRKTANIHELSSLDWSGCAPARTMAYLRKPSSGPKTNTSSALSAESFLNMGNNERHFGLMRKVNRSVKVGYEGCGYGAGN